MLKSIASGLRIATAAILLSANSVLHIGPLLLVAVLKATIPVRRVRRYCDRALMALAASWIDFNSWMFDHLTDTRLQVTGLPQPMPRGQLLVICNHQSWVDIPVLQKLFNHRLPLLRFFLKSTLFWVPLLGLAWWALDFPFMKRHTRAQIEKRPELARRDLEATRKACAKFRDLPVAIVNFAEGTRFTPIKHEKQQSPYQHLLKPRAGGIAFALDAMGEAIDTVVDVTIDYPGGRPRLVDLFANRVGEIRVAIRTLPVPESIRGGDYDNERAFRKHTREWINTLWAEKDRQIASMRQT